jgi:hypothetical protein
VVGRIRKEGDPSVTDRPTEDEFEDFVAAALKVDPKGLSGKHRKEAEKLEPVRPDKRAR